MRDSFRALVLESSLRASLRVACVAVLLSGLPLGSGCAAYDSGLVKPRPAPAAPGMGKDASDPGKLDASDSDAQLDARAQRDADARVEAGAAVDCGDSGVDCCPADPRKRAPGQCGCGVADVDGDGDGTADCKDGCPGDSKKTTPGACGCGGSDADRDGDGTADCKDGCPSDPMKAAPGACGCGVPDVDSNGDGTADCVDGCPSDPAKTAPGVCGCGVPDTDQGSSVGCAGLRSALVHRYRFDGSGTAVTDSRGGQSGSVMSAQLSGAGKLDLSGNNQFVDLPNGLVSGLTNATLELWLTWNGGNAWQRIFDFGDNDNATEGNQGNGKTYLYLAAASSSNVLQLSYSRNASGSEIKVSGSAGLPTGGMHHVAAVFDDANNRMQLYLDGASIGSATVNESLSSIHDINDWLGRSQYSNDPELNGSLYELRIYNAALSAAQITVSAGAGPDPAFLNDL